MPIIRKGAPPPEPGATGAHYKLTAKIVREWMREAKAGIRPAAAHFGVPEPAIRALLGGDTFVPGPGLAGSEPWAPSGQEDDPGEPGDAFVAVGRISPPDVGTLDPATATTKQFLEWRVRFAIAMVDAAIAAGSPNIGKNWEGIAQSARRHLDEHIEDLERKEAEKGRGNITDPVAVARRVLKRAGELARLAPEECREIAESWGKVLRFRLSPLDEGATQEEA